MKTLVNIDTKPAPFEDNVSDDILLTIPSYRKLFRAAVGLCEAKDGENALDLIQIGLKLKCEGDVSIEDAEFKLLKETCSKNPCKWVANYHGQVMLKLKESEKE